MASFMMAEQDGDAGSHATSNGPDSSEPSSSSPTIAGDVLIEDLVREHPTSVRFLMRRGVKCIACGEPIWGTLAEAAREKGFDDEEIDGIVEDLVAFLHTGEA